MWASGNPLYYSQKQNTSIKRPTVASHKLLMNKKKLNEKVHKKEQKTIHFIIITKKSVSSSLFTNSMKKKKLW